MIRTVFEPRNLDLSELVDGQGYAAKAIRHDIDAMRSGSEHGKGVIVSGLRGTGRTQAVLTALGLGYDDYLEMVRLAEHGDYTNAIRLGEELIGVPVLVLDYAWFFNGETYEKYRNVILSDSDIDTFIVAIMTPFYLQTLLSGNSNLRTDYWMVSINLSAEETAGIAEKVIGKHTPVIRELSSAVRSPKTVARLAVLLEDQGVDVPGLVMDGGKVLVDYFFDKLAPMYHTDVIKWLRALDWIVSDEKLVSRLLDGKFSASDLRGYSNRPSRIMNSLAKRGIVERAWPRFRFTQEFLEASIVSAVNRVQAPVYVGEYIEYWNHIMGRK